MSTATTVRCQSALPAQELRTLTSHRLVLGGETWMASVLIHRGANHLKIDNIGEVHNHDFCLDGTVQDQIVDFSEKSCDRKSLERES